MYPSSFSKSDKQALQKRAKFFNVKGAELYCTGRGENQNDVLQLQVMSHHSFSFLMHTTRVDDGCLGTTRLVVESVDKELSP